LHLLLEVFFQQRHFRKHAPLHPVHEGRRWAYDTVPDCLFPANGTRTGGFWAAGEYSVRPKAAGLVVVLTLIPASAMLLPMASLLQTGSGMISTRADRGRPGSADKRFLINGFIGFTLWNAREHGTLHVLPQAEKQG
jgi:hypothetical protein